MTNVELGLSRSKREPGFMTREPKFTAIVAHAHGALIVDVANRCIYIWRIYFRMAKTACGEQHDLEVVLPLSTSKERWSYVESRIYKVGQDPNSEKWSLFTM